MHSWLLVAFLGCYGDLETYHAVSLCLGPTSRTLKSTTNGYDYPGNAKIMNSSNGEDLLSETGMSNYDYTIALMVFLVAYGIFE